MRKVTRHILLTISVLIVAAATVIWIFDYRSNRRETEACRMPYPDGVHTLVISHVGNPIFPYGADRMKISVLEGKKSVFDTLVFVYNDGVRGLYEVEWQDGTPVITLRGDEMDDIVVTATPS
jgi:hypothetical protein